MKAGLPLAHHHDLSASFFQEQWQIYRKVVDNNYFYHREVYGQLHRILVDEAVSSRSGSWISRVVTLERLLTHSREPGWRTITGSISPRRRWIWRARLLRRSPVLSRSTTAISSRRCAIGPSPWMSRGSVCRYITSSLRIS